MLEVLVAVSVRRNPGPGGIGIVITNTDDGEVWPGISQLLEGSVTNVEAELAAVSIALQVVIDKGCVYDLKIKIATTGTIDIIQRAIDDDQDCRPYQEHLQPWFDKITSQAKEITERDASIKLFQAPKETLVSAKKLARKAF